MPSATHWGIGVLVAGLVCSTFGCGSDDDPAGPVEDPESLNEPPPGTGEGRAFEGVYDVEVFTSVCEGECTTDSAGWSYVACNLGEVDPRQIRIVQRDGELSMTLSGYSVQRLKGGVDADGSFQIGGYASDSSSGVESTAHVMGRFDAEGDALSLEAEVDGLLWAEGRQCRTGYEVTGLRTDLID